MGQVHVSALDGEGAVDDGEQVVVLGLPEGLADGPLGQDADDEVQDREQGQAGAQHQDGPHRQDEEARAGTAVAAVVAVRRVRPLPAEAAEQRQSQARQHHQKDGAHRQTHVVPAQPNNFCQHGPHQRINTAVKLKDGILYNL